MAEYIDREAFKKSVDERYCKPCKGAGKDHNGCWCRVCWVDDMLDEIDCFSAADVAPVVHGRWYMLDDCANAGLYCSACGRRVHREEFAYKKLKSKYCPHCGAKMDATM